MRLRTDWLGPVRLTLRILLMALTLIPALIFHGLWGLFRIPSPWPRYYLHGVARTCGLRTRTIGRPVRSDVFYVANHVGWMDICILAGATGCAFVAQDKIEKWPLIGWLARRNYTVFVSRTDRLGIGAQIEVLRAALAEKTPVTIFPEGTTTNGRSLIPFKPSLFAVVVPPPKPMQVQPIALHFDDVGVNLAWVRNETAPQNALRVIRNGRAWRVLVEYLEPFDPSDCANRKAVAIKAQAAIDTALRARGGIDIDPVYFLPPYPLFPAQAAAASAVIA